MSTKTKGICNNGETCKKCKYPCVNQGENLRPITIDELREKGYILCEDYIEEYLDEKND